MRMGYMDRGLPVEVVATVLVTLAKAPAVYVSVCGGGLHTFQEPLGH